MGVMAGYGIKVQTDTGHWLWLKFGEGTARVKTARDVYRQDSEAGAEMEADALRKLNPHAVFKVVKF
jgi:hypothetical protein